MVYAQHLGPVLAENTHIHTHTLASTCMFLEMRPRPFQIHQSHWLCVSFYRQRSIESIDQPPLIRSLYRMQSCLLVYKNCTFIVGLAGARPHILRIFSHKADFKVKSKESKRDGRKFGRIFLVTTLFVDQPK